MIIQAIIEILKTEDSVFINDLGLFTKLFVSAQLKDELLYPPQNKIKFNPKSDGNGFAFILKLSEKIQKRIPEADSDVKSWVEKLKSAVENNKSVSFDNFGTFFMNAKGELGFDSDTIIELNTEYEGMNPIEVKSQENEVLSEPAPSIQPIKEEVPETTSEDKNNSPALDIPAVNGIAAVCATPEEVKITENLKDTTPTEPIMQDFVLENKDETKTLISNDNSRQEKEMTPKKKIRKGAIFLTILLLLFLALGAFCYFNWVPIELTIKDNIHKYFDKKPVQHIVPPGAESEYQILSQAIETGCCKQKDILIPFLHGYLEANDNLPDNADSASVEKSFTTDEVPITSPSTTEFQKTLFQKGKYYVIAGSFISEHDAAIHIKERSLQYLKPLLLYQEGNNRIRVCIGIYDNENEANVFVKKINRNYWVLK